MGRREEYGGITCGERCYAFWMESFSGMRCDGMTTISMHSYGEPARVLDITSGRGQISSRDHDDAIKGFYDQRFGVGCVCVRSYMYGRMLLFR